MFQYITRMVKLKRYSRQIKNKKKEKKKKKKKRYKNIIAIVQLWHQLYNFGTNEHFFSYNYAFNSSHLRIRIDNMQ